MSHHPPISVFYLQGPKNKFKFYGYYEYIARLKSVTGNSVDGQFKGPSTVEFQNGDKITYTLPFMCISGLLYGKRIIQWEKGLEFVDHVNNIKAILNFTPEPRFFQKFKELHVQQSNLNHLYQEHFFPNKLHHLISDYIMIEVTYQS